MMNVCFQCGMYHADKLIDPAGPFAVCPECGFKHPFRQLPLLIVSGASGAGKSTVCQQLTGQLTQAVLLDSDILWRPEFNRPETKYRDYFDLRLAIILLEPVIEADMPVDILCIPRASPDGSSL